MSRTTSALTRDFWAGRRVLLTGHTGFKGAWLALWLQKLGSEVHGLALPARSAGAFSALGLGLGQHSHLADLRELPAVQEVVRAVEPEVVFHLGAQALVRTGYRDPAGTYATNVLGTVHLLDALRGSPSTRAVVVVTSDKVYANAGEGQPFAEDDPLQGSDPYSGSKVCAEMVVQAWRKALPADAPIAIATARAGNVIGGGDIAPDRLLPDAWRAITTTTPLVLRYPDAIRPWQFVLEPLLGYLLLAQRLTLAPATAPHSLNFGPEAESCRSVVEIAQNVFELMGAGTWELERRAQPAEASLLTLESSKARDVLAWRGRLDLDEALEWTTAWWRKERRGGGLHELAISQVEAYEALLSSP